MALTYSTMPSLSQFEKDSSVRFAVRHTDVVLKRIDYLLKRYNVQASLAPIDRTRETGELINIILCELYLTLSYWLRENRGGQRLPAVQQGQRNPDFRPRAMEAGREPAIAALFDRVVRELSGVFGCSAGQVQQYIEEVFGRDLTQAGMTTDASKNGVYFDWYEREINRLRFKGGRAYHRNAKFILVPLNSKDYSPDVLIERKINGVKSVGFYKWAGFVMTMDRRFYMAKHHVATPEDEDQQHNVFHSAYTGGGMVSMAGSMLIRDGKILGIRGDSGHYQPLNHNIVAALLALQMHGVELRRIKIYTHDAKDEKSSVGTGDKVVKRGLTWQQYLNARADLLSKRPGAPADGEDLDEDLYNTPDEAYNV
jgi:hypothetical protein